MDVDEDGSNVNFLLLRLEHTAYLQFLVLVVALCLCTHTLAYVLLQYSTLIHHIKTSYLPSSDAPVTKSSQKT